MGLSYPVKQSRCRKANIKCFVPFVNLRIYGAIQQHIYIYKSRRETWERKETHGERRRRKIVWRINTAKVNSILEKCCPHEIQ